MSELHECLRESIQQAQTPQEIERLERVIASIESTRWIVPTLQDVAAFFGVENQTVRTWRIAATPMPGEEGKWNLRDIAQWKIAQTKTSGREKTTEEIEIELESARLDLAQKRLKYREASGDLVSRAAAKAKVFEILNDARCQLEAVPGIVGAHVNPEYKDDLVNEWEQQIGLILRTMAGKAEASSA